MQKNGIRAILRRKFKTKKQQTDNRAPNILDQNFIVDQPNKVWVYLYKNQGRMLAGSIFTYGSWLVDE